MHNLQLDTVYFWLNSLQVPFPKYYQFFSCTTCNPQIQQKIYDSTFLPNLLTMLSAFIVLTGIVALLTYLSNKKHTAFITAHPNSSVLNPVPLTTASMVLGIGIGGFIDGIMLHQILQWHAMISNKIPPITVTTKSINMFWDGIFHFFTLIVVIVGVLLLWKLLFRKGIDRSGKLLGGGLLLGWGLFNVVEGVINHHIIKLHNINELSLNHDLGNFVFLVLSVVMLIIGYFLVNKRKM